MFSPKKKKPSQDEKYQWTLHVQEKMRYYNLSPSRIKRIIRHPKRVEEGIAPNTIAAMCPAETKKYQEIWVLYQIKNQKSNIKSTSQKFKNTKTQKQFSNKGHRIRIISAWRYPGKSPERNPIPKEILDEVKIIL